MRLQAKLLIDLFFLVTVVGMKQNTEIGFVLYSNPGLRLRTRKQQKAKI